MYYSEDWQWSRLYQDYYIREEDWDSSWPGADDLWEWDENDDYYYLWWSHYDWDWYFAPLDLVEPEPDCYSWYYDMYNADGWKYSDWHKDSYIYQEDWSTKWLGADDIWEWDSDANAYFLYWSNYDWDTYEKPCPDCYDWADAMEYSIGWTNSLVSNRAYHFQQDWEDEWLGADDLW